jgi:hypothetical protein
MSRLVDEKVDSKDDMVVECGYGAANALREWLGQEAAEIGLGCQPGEHERLPYTIFDGPASGLQEEFQRRGLNITVRQPVLSREEHLVLSQYMGFFCPEARQVLGAFCEAEQFAQRPMVEHAVARLLHDPDDDDRDDDELEDSKNKFHSASGLPLAAAVARILLAGSWNTLPNFTRVIETGSGIRKQKIRGKSSLESRKRKHQSIPQLISEIVWSENFVTWFSRYLLVWVPCYDRQVVIETTDTWEQNGYFDLARGICAPRKPLKQSIKAILISHWEDEMSRFADCDHDLYPWERVSEAGFLSRNEAVACRTKAWGKNWVPSWDEE